MAEWPKQIEAFETSDREMHRSRAVAEHWQGRIDGAELATKMLEEGASLGAALRAGGFLPDGCYPELDEVTASTKLVISHWQCREEAGYSPCRVNPQGGIFVFGNAGSWSGSYGADCSSVDVARYWTTTKARAEGRFE